MIRLKFTEVFLTAALFTGLLLACGLPTPPSTLSPTSPLPSPIAGPGPQAGEAAPSGNLDLTYLIPGGIGLAIFLVAGIAVLLLFRRSRRRRAAATPRSPKRTKKLRPATARLAEEAAPTGPASVKLAPLPERALIGGGEYMVAGVLQTSGPANAYVVERTTLVRFCPNCHIQVEDREERFCSNCGADLQSVAPVYPRFLAKETPDERGFAVTSQLLTMHLNHPGVVLPAAVFVETNFGPARYIQVEPDVRPSLASNLPVPQALEPMLVWGVGLAKAMAYLHYAHVVLRQVDVDHMVIKNGMARWLCFENAYVIPKEARSQADEYFTPDVKALANTLFYLLTGQTQIGPHADLPQGVATLFTQVQAATGDLTAVAFAGALERALHEIRPSKGQRLLIGRRTDVGQERSLNEDSILVLDYSAAFRSLGVPVGVFAVADGMGGHEAGDVASRLTVEAIAQEGEALASPANGVSLPDPQEWVKQTTWAANQGVFSQRKAASNDMGCTLVLALFIGDTATLVNVGDSRAYHLTQSGIRKITVDHSLVERLIAAGQITEEEARHHPKRNVIYRVIGDKPRLDVDIYEETVGPDEALLICSDGLSGMVVNDLIWQIWRTSTSPQEACDRLVEEANRAGGEDNISVIIVQVDR